MSGRTHAKSQAGYVTLFSVLVISAIAITLTLSLILISLGTSRNSLSSGQSKQALSLATACAEEAIEQLVANVSHTGPGNLALGQGTCTYTITNTGGQSRTIDASGMSGPAIRRVKVQLSGLSPSVTVASWQDVADF